MATILDGKKIADMRLEILKEEIADSGLSPTTGDRDCGSRSGITDVYQDEAPGLRAGWYRFGWDGAGGRCNNRTGITSC